MSLVSFLGAENQMLAQRASLVHIGLLDYNSADNSCLDIVFGSGVCFIEGKGLVQVLLVSRDETRLESGFHSIGEDDRVLSLLRTAIGEYFDWIADMVIYVIPTPEIQAKAGDRISATSFGTAGASVSWRNGAGFLTAGHVAPQGSSVTLRGKNWSSISQIGTTRYCGYRVGTPNSPMADISVVELQPGQAYQSSFSGTRAVQANQSVDIYSPMSGSTAIIMGYCTFVHWPKTNATYGNCYFTTRHATRRGHSGSAVSALNTQELVGMVVGGTPKYTTYIQDIAYLMASIPQASYGLVGLSV